VKFLRRSDGGVITNITAHNGSVHGLALSADGNLLASAKVSQRCRFLVLAIPPFIFSSCSCPTGTCQSVFAQAFPKVSRNGSRSESSRKMGSLRSPRFNR